MRVTLPACSATYVASVQVGMLAFALALPACVLSEHFSAGDDDGSTGAAGAMPVTDSAPAGSSGGSSPPDTAETTADAANDDESSTGGDDATTARPEDVPEPDTGTTAGPTVFGDDCCMPSEGIGCGDPKVEACVCGLDAYCCETAWDDVCVDLMIDAGCMGCEASTKLVPDTCCVAADGPGCAEEPVRDCVCAVDPFCCDVLWDDTCVALVDEHACGTCQPAACCQPSVLPGCGVDPEIESCVCAADPFCCDEQWDNLCVSEVTTVGCGDCAWISEGGDCCAAHGTPGCDDPGIEACVCPGDPFCCQTSWDSLCVEEVGTYGCAMCPGTQDPPDTDSGDSGAMTSATSYGSETG